ncbi:copper transporter 6 [Ziziphus jujuba]|uniref:Copper transport protein n=1 Tax=Ziziphus jujuba TaxID=326968 RepID=A0ABM3I4A0_ZIZJJ|nr:copper transporter 6 [Ziziphus jujuba]
MATTSTTSSHHDLGGWSETPFNHTGNMHFRRRKIFMHMTFFWGHNTEVLFQGWPGTRSSMYALSLVFVFFLAFVVECLSNCHLIKPGTSNAVAGTLRTAMYTLRSGLSYLVMLAVMSFNGGVFLAAVGGHAVGFIVFGTRASMKSSGGGSGSDKRTDLPPMEC